jgi:hypothetical protein
MSRRPQEPPRSVGRYHRLTSLKTSGIADQLFKACRCCQKIRGAREFVSTNQEFTNSPFCAAGARHAFTHKDSQSREDYVRNSAATQPLFLKSHGCIGAQREFELKDDPLGSPPTAVAEGDP